MKCLFIIAFTLSFAMPMCHCAECRYPECRGAVVVVNASAASQIRFVSAFKVEK